MKYLENVACLLIHHRNFPKVLQSVDSLIKSGVDPAALLLVDNSEDERIVASLVAALPAGATLISIPNAGYANAVNVGVAALLTSGIERDYLLIATHDVSASALALYELLKALTMDAKAAVVGPTLLDASKSQQTVWSIGGKRSRLLGLPEHVGAGMSAYRIQDRRPVRRDWLDGSFCLYRTIVFSSQPLDERFVMYFEDFDFHLRLGDAGFDVVWVPTAFVTQSTDGVPAYFLARNCRMVAAKHGLSWAERELGPRYLVLKFMVNMLGRRKPYVLRELMRGWRDGGTMTIRGLATPLSVDPGRPVVQRPGA